MSRVEKFKKILKENIKNYKNILELLDYISRQIKYKGIYEKIKKSNTLSLEEKILISSYFHNFSLLIDILINKLLRSIAYLEYEEGKTKRDLIIWAEKMGFVEKESILGELLDLRNLIAHEYNNLDKVQEIMEVLLENEKNLYLIFENIKKYLSKNRL